MSRFLRQIWMREEAERPESIVEGDDHGTFGGEVLAVIPRKAARPSGETAAIDPHHDRPACRSASWRWSRRWHTDSPRRVPAHAEAQRRLAPARERRHEHRHHHGRQGERRRRMARQRRRRCARPPTWAAGRGARPPALSEGRRGVRNAFEHTDRRLHGARDRRRARPCDNHVIRNQGRWPRDEQTGHR